MRRGVSCRRGGVSCRRGGISCRLGSKARPCDARRWRRSTRGWIGGGVLAAAVSRSSSFDACCAPIVACDTCRPRLEISRGRGSTPPRATDAAPPRVRSSLARCSVRPPARSPVTRCASPSGRPRWARTAGSPRWARATSARLASRRTTARSTPSAPTSSAPRRTTERYARVRSEPHHREPHPNPRDPHPNPDPRPARAGIHPGG